MTEAFEKEVSASDRFFIAYNDVRPPFVIQLTLEGDGDPDPDALHEALTKTTAANPGSSLRIDKSGPEPRWVIGPEPTLTVFDAPDWAGDCDGPIAPFLLWPLDPYEGPTCELVFVRGKSKRYLIFRALHAVMDGQGTLLWVKDFMRALRGEAPLGHRGLLTVDQLIRELDAERRPSPVPDALHPYGLANPETRGEFHWRRISVDRPLDSAVTGRICVAIAKQARTHGEGNVRINLPTDLRYLCPKEKTTGNFFSSLMIEVPPDATSAAVGLKVIQMLYKKEGTRPVGLYSGDEVGSIAAFRVKALWDMMHLHDTGRYGFSATLSHLGILKSAELSAPTFATTAAFFVPLVGDSGCVMSLNGFEDRTEAAVGLSDRFSGNGNLEHLASLIQSAIEDAG